MSNRLSKFKQPTNSALQNKSSSVTDTNFLKKSSDRSKPAPIKLVLDDIEAINKNNALVDVIGAPQTNFAPFGNQLANESSTTQNATPSATPPRSNPLHDFEPVNYIVSLSCLSRDAFNSGGSGQEILIARSGGKGAQGPGVLGNDYYIDNLVVRNTVSPTSQGKSGTVFQVLFDVTEPYGTSFVDALITSARQLGFENHLKAVFKLKIEFKGVDDDGNPSGAPIDFSTRIIPIHIYGVDLRVEAGVTTYQIQAVPATQLGNTELHGVTQEVLTVKGNTVGELLEDFFLQHSQTLEKLKELKRIVEPDVYTFSLEESDVDIIESKIPYSVTSSSTNVFNISNVQAPPGRAQKLREVTVPAGTPMRAFIEAVVRESEFYRNQFDQDGEPKSNKQFLKAMRTATRLQIISETGGGGGNRPRYEFIWAVRGFQVAANYFKKEATDIASNVLPVRTYQYLYTGQNKDILDFEITYKFAFYQIGPYFKQTGTNVANDAYSGEKPVDEEAEENTTGQQGVGTTQVTTESVRTYKDGFIADLNTVNGEVATIFEQIIQDPSADLIVTNMEIIGDPVWIEQKSVINESYADSFVQGSPNIDRFGAVATDEYEVYVQVDFKTPTDLDDETGLFKIQDAAFFQGKYKVFICESRFAGGVFTNVLQMVRMRHQPTDYERETFGQSTGTGQGNGLTTDTQDVAGGSTSPEVGSFGTGATGVSNPQVGSIGNNTTNNVQKLPTPKITIEFNPNKALNARGFNRD